MEEKVYELFEKLNIAYEKVEHPPLFVCGDDEKYGVKFDGLHCKNLFLRNKNKSNYYLVSMPAEKRADLRELQEKLEETRLSFGNEETLWEKLNIKSGSVSLLNIITVEKTDIEFIIDDELLKSEKVGFHPNVNTATVFFSPNEIRKILEYYNVRYRFLA